jgi:hypothetical protein
LETTKVRLGAERAGSAAGAEHDTCSFPKRIKIVGKNGKNNVSLKSPPSAPSPLEILQQNGVVFKLTAHLLPYILTTVSIALTSSGETRTHEVFTSSLTTGLKYIDSTS